MAGRSAKQDMEVLYKEADALSEHEHDLDAAFDLLFEKVLKRRMELSTTPLHKEMTTVYN